MEEGVVEKSESMLAEALKTKKEKKTTTTTTKKVSRTACTHAHTCNPPGPDDASHSHTCFHAHTHHFFIPHDQRENCEAKEKKRSDGSSSSLCPKTRPLGNREAVRRYREKKKAETAYLEEEVKRLRAENHALVRKLESQVRLEAEAVRLRGLLMDVGGKIDGELGALSFQKHCTGIGFLFKEEERGEM